MANYLAALHVHAGSFSAAAALIDEIDALTQATALPQLKYAAIMLAAARGDDPQTRFAERCATAWSAPRGPDSLSRSG